MNDLDELLASFDLAEQEASVDDQFAEVHTGHNAPERTISEISLHYELDEVLDDIDGSGQKQSGSRVGKQNNFGRGGRVVSVRAEKMLQGLQKAADEKADFDHQYVPGQPRMVKGGGRGNQFNPFADGGIQNQKATLRPTKNQNQDFINNNAPQLKTQSNYSPQQPQQQPQQVKQSPKKDTSSTKVNVHTTKIPSMQSGRRESTIEFDELLENSTKTQREEEEFLAALDDLLDDDDPLMNTVDVDLDEEENYSTKKEPVIYYGKNNPPPSSSFSSPQVSKSSPISSPAKSHHNDNINEDSLLSREEKATYDEFFALEQDLLNELNVETVDVEEIPSNRSSLALPTASAQLVRPGHADTPIQPRPPTNHVSRDFSSSSNVGLSDVDSLLGSLNSNIPDDPRAHMSPEDHIYEFIQKMPHSPIGICHKCQKPCSGNESINLGDRSYHILHYVCGGCGVSLRPENYYPMVRGEIICFKCENTIEDRKRRFTAPLGIQPLAPASTGYTGGMFCGACSLPIGGGFLEAMGKLWHNKCFHCAQCRDDLLSAGVTTKFFPKDGKPFCESCYRKALNFSY